MNACPPSSTDSADAATAALPAAAASLATAAAAASPRRGWCSGGNSAASAASAARVGMAVGSRSVLAERSADSRWQKRLLPSKACEGEGRGDAGELLVGG